MTSAAPAPAAIAGALSELDALVPELVELRRQQSALHAQEARLLARAGAIADAWASAGSSVSDASFAHRTVATELAAALRVSDRTVQRQIADAESLVSSFPATTAALEAGRISRAHARIIVEAGERIDEPELRAEYEDAVLPYAEAESSSRLAPVAKRRAQWFLNETVSQRHARARAERCVVVFDLDDGMAEVRATVDAALAHGIADRLTQMARDVGRSERPDAGADARDAGDTGAGGADGADTGSVETEPARTLDQLRADIFADLLLATDPVAHTGTSETGLGAIRAHVQVTVPVLSLLADDVADPFESAALDGHGPMDDDTARRLTAGAPGWDRILTHPISGAVVAVDRHEPSAQMRRHLQVRDRHCRFPGCRMSTRRSDLDHTRDYQFGGPTSPENLAHLCRRHHTLKHHSRWRVEQRPGGVLVWTSPTGRVYSDHPSSGVAFSVDPECDPAPF